MALQPAPVESHRSHWYAYFRRFPCQVPVLAVRAYGTRAVPLTEGGVTFFGGCCPGEEAPPEAPPVASISVSAPAVTAAVMRRLITSLPSGGIDCLVTLKRGRCVPILLLFPRNEAVVLPIPGQSAACDLSSPPDLVIGTETAITRALLLRASPAHACPRRGTSRSSTWGR